LNTKQWIAYSSSLLAFVLPSAGYAFGLADHARIMLQAAQEFSACFPGHLHPDDPSILVENDLDEDLNIARKDLLYSHFYNPYKTLKMLRFDSSIRVADVQTELEDRPNAIDLLAHAIHHLQDASAPPHVVPVMHGPWDGFEAYAFNGDISSGWSCQEIANETRAEDLLAILKETAIQTLANVNAIHLTLHTGASTLVLTGNLFWQSSSDDRFGQYGALGNHFGQPLLVSDGMSFYVPAGFYDDFKQTQLRLAVRSSIQALYWYFLSSQ
jgi:hypothetical protein